MKRRAVNTACPPCPATYVFSSPFPFLPSREVVQSLIDEYRACESPEYANYGGSYDNSQAGGELELPATAEAAPSAM